MRVIRFLAFALALSANHTAVGCQADDQPYVIEFQGEDGKSIPHAEFYLYELHKGQFRQALFRGHSLGVDAKIELKEMPEEFMLGIADRQSFYHQFWYAGQIKIVRGLNSIRVTKTGVVTIDFGFVDPKIPNPLVVPYYRRNEKGNYVQVSGIGIFLGPGRPFEIEGLAPGDYKFELKEDYQSPNVYWQASDVVVKAGEVTKLHNQATLVGK